MSNAHLFYCDRYLEILAIAQIYHYELILADQIKSLDWQVRKIDFIEKASENIIDFNNFVLHLASPLRRDIYPFSNLDQH